MKQQLLEAQVKDLEDALRDATSALITVQANIGALTLPAWIPGYMANALNKSTQALRRSRDGTAKIQDRRHEISKPVGDQVI